VANEIKISLEVEGAPRAASSVSDVTRSLESMERAQQTAALKAIKFSQRLAGAANAVQALTQQLGGTGTAAGLAGSMAANASAMAQLGASFGPQGALVGGIIGAAMPAISRLNSELERQQTLLDAARRAAGQLAGSYNDLLGSIQRASSERERLQRLESGRGSMDEQRAFSEQATRLSQLAERALAGDQGALAEMRSRGLTGRTRTQATTTERFASAVTGRPALNIEDEQERDQIRMVADSARRQARQRMALEPMAAERELAAAGARLARAEGGAEGGGGRGGPSRWELEEEAWNRYNEGVQRGLRQQDEFKREQIRLEEEYRQKIEERAAAELEAELAIKRVEEETRARELEAMEERKRLQLEIDDKLRENSERVRREHERAVEGYSEATGVIVGGLTDALTAIVAGEKSAEQAFKGMLASFLEYIAEQAALKAIFEGAEAIAAFASQRYDQGALHLAAAAGYVAVAVAAGAGAAAISAPSAPAEPEGGRSDAGGGGGGGTIVINMNAPAVIAGTRAELGRELQQTIAASQSRYG